MAIIHKITHGYVRQTYDTERNVWLSQIFYAGDDVSWEIEDSSLIGLPSADPYLPFHMKQPDKEPILTLSCRDCNGQGCHQNGEKCGSCGGRGYFPA